MFYIFVFRLITNGWRVGDVALFCACGKAILLTRCYRLVNSNLYISSFILYNKH
jgi:hypothetical protein